MNQQLGKIDKLEFHWDYAYAKKIKEQSIDKCKITETTECHLEEYFAFLEDVLPSSLPLRKVSSVERKIFDLS